MATRTRSASSITHDDLEAQYDILAAADRLGISPGFVRHLVTTKQIGHLRVGRFVRITERHCREYLAQCERPADPGYRPSRRRRSPHSLTHAQVA